MKGILFIVACDVVEGHCRELVYCLALAVDNELLCDYLFCFFEVLYGLHEVGYVAKEILYFRYERPVLLSSSMMFWILASSSRFCLLIIIISLLSALTIFARNYQKVFFLYLIFWSLFNLLIV